MMERHLDQARAIMEEVRSIDPPVAEVPTATAPSSWGSVHRPSDGGGRGRLEYGRGDRDQPRRRYDRDENQRYDQDNRRDDRRRFDREDNHRGPPSWSRDVTDAHSGGGDGNGSQQSNEFGRRLDHLRDAVVQNEGTRVDEAPGIIPVLYTYARLVPTIMILQVPVCWVL